MPTRPARACGLCGGVHQSGERCPVTIRRDGERKARHDATRPSAAARGYDAEWRRLRAEHLDANPLCVRCGAPAIVADHVVSVRRAPHRRLDPTNLQSLCINHHSGAKQAEERRPAQRSIWL